MPGAETFRASADAYDRHVGRYGAPLAAALIAFARVEPGMRALDVGCGPPFPTGVAPSGAFCKSLDDDRRAALNRAYRRRLRTGDGPFELSARAWAVAGIVQQ